MLCVACGESFNNRSVGVMSMTGYMPYPLPTAAGCVCYE